jgi:hypothetical protein
MFFNINEKVKVRLTDFGRKKYKEDLEKLFAAFAINHTVQPKLEDAEGWSQWQLYDLMSTLGVYCTIGGELPFEPTIIILDGENNADSKTTD